LTTYTVIEKQITDQGQQSILQQSYTDKNQALSDVFLRLSYAATSALPYHSAHLLEFVGSDVYVSTGMAFDRSVDVEEAAEE